MRTVAVDLFKRIEKLERQARCVLRVLFVDLPPVQQIQHALASKLARLHARRRRRSLAYQIIGDQAFTQCSITERDFVHAGRFKDRLKQYASRNNLFYSFLIQPRHL